MSETAAFSYSHATLQQFSEDVLKHARAKGATACEVDVSEGFGQSVTVRCDEVETIEFNRDKGIGITVYSGQRKGYASTSDFSAQALRETVEAALDIARFTAEDDCAGLADAALMAKDCPDLDLFHPWALTVEDAIETARRCEQAAFDASPLVSNSEGASISTQQAHFVSANSLGFMGATRLRAITFPARSFPANRMPCSVTTGTPRTGMRGIWMMRRKWAVLRLNVRLPGWAGAGSRPVNSRSFSKHR
jgi:PmbA protein